jgi:hypothetical protein
MRLRVTSRDRIAKPRVQQEGILGGLRMHKMPMRERANCMQEHRSVGYMHSYKIVEVNKSDQLGIWSLGWCAGLSQRLQARRNEYMSAGRRKGWQCGTVE